MARAWVPVMAIAVVSIVSATLLASATAQSDEPNGTYTRSSQVYDAIYRKPVKGSPEYNQLFVKQTTDINSMILAPFVPASITAKLPHFLATWLRNWFAGAILYALSGGIGCLKTFVWKRNPANKLKLKPVLEQIVMGLTGLPILTWLPSFAEYIVEKGWTLCYVQIEEVGWANWALHIGAYLLFCEFWVYWFHRLLHVPFFYKHLHRTHHQYNKLDTVSPFAGLAFNPFDGILQASPLVFALLVIPMHFQTYYILFFLEEIWSGNIHDTMEDGYFGILGSSYHNFHHTHYKYNYGHLTTGMDWLFGTLIEPKVGVPKHKRAAAGDVDKALKSS